MREASDDAGIGNGVGWCASGSRYLFNVAQKRSAGIGAYYDDRYVKLAGASKIAHTEYTYVFREQWSREDTPSLRLVAP